MQPVRLESSTLASALYEADLRRLRLEFRSGEQYVFFQVPPACYQLLLQSPSKGAYFNSQIRNRFPCRHLSHPSAPVVLATPDKTK